MSKSRKTASNELTTHSKKTSNCLLCGCKFKDSGYPMERKVADSSGRLGSLYDATTDHLIDQHSVKRYNTKELSQPIVCKAFSGADSRSLDVVLRNLDFDDTLQQNITVRTVIPSGIGRLIDFNPPINENTRFLYYSYRPRKDKLDVEARKTQRIVEPPSSSTNATHMITKIAWGIEVLLIIQIPKGQPTDAVDHLLNRIRDQLKHNRVPIRLDNNEQRIISQLNITAYGTETCINDPKTTFTTIITNIPSWQRNSNFHQPVIYTMQPLRWLYGPKLFPEPPFKPRQKDSRIIEAETIIRRINNQMRKLGEIFPKFPSHFESPTLDEKLKEHRRHYRLLLDTQDDLQERVAKGITEVRRHHIQSKTLDNIIADQRYDCLHENEIEKFITNVERLLHKTTLIKNLQKDHIQYRNAMDLSSEKRLPMTIQNIDTALKRSYSNKNIPVILIYSTDRLLREQAEKWEQIKQQLILEQQKIREQIQFIYVDFTYCQQRLEDFSVIKFLLRETSIPIYASDTRTPSEERSNSPPTRRPTKETSMKIMEQRPTITKTEPHVSPPISTTLLPNKFHGITEPPPPPPVTDINVLLLGETGVGKSTFINAFVNYLKFESLEQAEKGEPVVVIPVSFLLTSGDNFDEFIVKFGKVDPNENHGHEGQSVTQQCRSYIIDLNDRYRLRLIDTPGIGDTRGIDQDVKSINHILTYINSLSHLNMICLLLKSNESRLNIFFRSCINQLLTYLTPVGYDNISFCFTNSRSTFYTPGNTGPLLRQMLNNEHLQDIPFKKENTFCFDSESFRYLAARKCNFVFDDYQKHESKESWKTSMNQSIRLLNFIRQRQPYYLGEWLSPRKVSLDISTLARPLMETLRLIIYNWKLNEANMTGNQIVLNANSLNIEICTNCAQVNLIQIGPFWLTQYQPSILKNKSNQHSNCPSNARHFLIETIIKYKFITESPGINNERWENSFHNLLLKCDKLNHFLRQQGPSNQDDPFLPILERFLDEEQNISQNRSIDSTMNRQIREVLQSIQRIRQQNSQRLFQSNERLSLKQVSEIMDELIAIPTVKQQLDCINQSRQLKREANETMMPKNSINNKNFM